MRQLIIKRKKSIIGCLMKVHIYIEDISNSELIISGFNCRKIGELKNNSDIVIDIDENEHRIFAIIDVVSKDFCYDMFVIPEGITDIELTGKCKLSPMEGNPFIFNKK